MGLTDALLLDPYPFEIWIAQRSDGQKGSGTLNDPYDGSTAAKFDGIMNGLPGPTCVHLGPGEFQTAGYRVDAVGWQIKPGMRIIGSGLDVTVLKLVNASTAGQYFAIGHQLTTGSGASEVKNPMDFCEVADMTIDCNLGNQSGTQVACGAIRLMGHHVRIRRVKAMNWGTKDSTKCFAFQLITGVITAATPPVRFEVVNAGIQQCVAESPNTGGTGPLTAFHIGGREDAAVNAELYGRACFIRNCFVDGDPGNLTRDIRGLSMGWCKAGVVEGNQVHNVKIGGPYQDQASSREIVVRNNSYRNVIRGPYWKLDIYEFLLPIEYALCCQPLGRCAEALRTYERVLSIPDLPERWRQVCVSNRELSHNGSPPRLPDVTDHPLHVTDL